MLQGGATSFPGRVPKISRVGAKTICCDARRCWQAKRAARTLPAPENFLIKFNLYLVYLRIAPVFRGDLLV